MNYINNFIKHYDPTNKYIVKPKLDLTDIINKINNKKSWNLQEAKEYLDNLTELKKNAFNKNNDEKVKKIDFYISYIEHQIDVLNYFQSQLLMVITTIFLPLNFIASFFGMNFKSMGAPTLNNNGIFNLKRADSKIMLFAVINTILIIYIFYGILKIY